MMRVFKTRYFARFARQESIFDETLAKAIRDAESGIIAVELGGGLIKLRVARPGGGKRGGYRTLIAYAKGRRAPCFYLASPRTNRKTSIPNSLPILRPRQPTF